MSDYVGMTARQRARQRHTNEQRVMDQAKQDAYGLGRSYNCGVRRDHAPDGCRNTGATCLCECHDPAEVADRG